MNAMDAEIVVSALVEKLQKVISQYPMLEKQVQEAIKNLNLLKRHLKVAEDLEASTGPLINDDQKLVQLLQAVYSADDTADTLLTREAFRIKKKVNGSEKKFRRWRCFSHGHETEKFNNEFTEYLSSYGRLVDMTSHIKDVGYNTDTRSSSQNYHRGQQQRWERIYDFCFHKETDAIGFQEEIKLLLNLISIPDQAPSSRVIAVVGGRGSGKTALVRTVYSKLLERRAFDRQAWVNVTGLVKARHFLADILKQIQEIPSVEDETTISEEELIAEIREKLRGKRSHIVVEDVDSHQVWESIGRGLCSSLSSGRCRITITTRNEDIAFSAAANDSIVNVGKLTDEESWELFLKEVQKDKDISNKSDQLSTFKELILEVCGNLPLRIVLLGGLLSTKEMSQWSRVIERAKARDILALSYQELPTQVKPCFLYMGLFPGRYEIPVRRLIHLWVAEGFVTAPWDSTATEPATETVPEDIAEMYFEELVIRNMIQVRWRLDGTPKTCCMPGLLYDIFSSKAADARFFYRQLRSSHESSDKQPQFAVRRLAKRVGIKNKFRSSLHENLRSYLAFDTRIQCSPATEIGTFLNKIITKRGFGLLKVLDLEGVYKPMLSNDVIGKLFLLSYLGLRSTAIDSLPSSLGNLPCLETLDVKHTIIHDLPTSLWKAKKLRHLYLNWSCSSNFSSSLLPSQPPTNLHTLWGLSIDDVGFGFLKKLTGLRKLGLTQTSPSEATAKWVSELAELQSLKLRSIRKVYQYYPPFDLEFPAMRTQHKLQDLFLLGNPSARSLTNAEFPPNLRMLTLSRSLLDNDPMPVLERLPHLHILRLFHLPNWGNRMTCSGGGFPKLRVLRLWDLLFGEWRVEEAAMPYLREIEIRSCTNLSRTSGLQHLTTLKKVTIINTPLKVSDFAESQERGLYICKEGIF